MAHVRKQIREAVAALVTGLASTGSRVYQSRVYPLRDADLPCLLIITDDEDLSSESAGSLLLQRELKLIVRGVVKAADDIDDKLDQILLEVEQVLSGSVLGGLAKQTMPESIRIQMEAIQDKPVGVADLTYIVTYFTTGANPATAL